MRIVALNCREKIKVSQWVGDCGSLCENISLFVPRQLLNCIVNLHKNVVIVCICLNNMIVHMFLLYFFGVQILTANKRLNCALGAHLKECLC